MSMFKLFNLVAHSTLNTSLIPNDTAIAVAPATTPRAPTIAVGARNADTDVAARDSQVAFRASLRSLGENYHRLSQLAPAAREALLLQSQSEWQNGAAALEAAPAVAQKRLLLQFLFATTVLRKSEGVDHLYRRQDANYRSLIARLSACDPGQGRKLERWLAQRPSEKDFLETVQAIMAKLDPAQQLALLTDAEKGVELPQPADATLDAWSERVGFSEAAVAAGYRALLDAEYARLFPSRALIHEIRSLWDAQRKETLVALEYLAPLFDAVRTARADLQQLHDTHLACAWRLAALRQANQALSMGLALEEFMLDASHRLDRTFSAQHV